MLKEPQLINFAIIDFVLLTLHQLLLHSLKAFIGFSS